MAKDKYHFIVKDLLERDGWTISHDPYDLKMIVYDEIDKKIVAWKS